MERNTAHGVRWIALFALAGSIWLIACAMAYGVAVWIALLFSRTFPHPFIYFLTQSTIYAPLLLLGVAPLWWLIFRLVTRPTRA